MLGWEKLSLAQRAACLVTLGAPQGASWAGVLPNLLVAVGPRDWDKWSWAQLMYLQHLGQPGDATELRCLPAGWSGRQHKVLLIELLVV